MAKNGGGEGSNRQVQRGGGRGDLRRHSLRLLRVPRESKSGSRGEMQAGRGLGCGCYSKGTRSGERGRTWEWAGGFGSQQQRERERLQEEGDNKRALLISCWRERGGEGRWPAGPTGPAGGK